MSSFFNLVLLHNIGRVEVNRVFFNVQYIIHIGVSFLHFIFSFSACLGAFGTRIWTRLVSVAVLAKHVAQY